MNKAEIEEEIKALQERIEQLKAQVKQPVVYVVMGQVGEYQDFTTWPAAVLPNRELAERFAAEATERARKAVVDWKKRGANRLVTPNPIVLDPQIKWDPDCYTTYSIKEVPFHGES